MITSTKGQKPVEWPTMTAPMDVQSAVDRAPWGRWRLSENWRAVQSGRLCRREGWRQFGKWTAHPNCDLYDKHGSTAPIRTLFSHASKGRGNLGNRVFAGCGSEVWMQRMDGGWSIVGTGREGGQWSIASQGNVVMAANGTTVLWQYVGDGTMSEPPGLSDIGVTGASVCWEYAGCFFLADLVQDGVQVGNRVIWSDPNSAEFKLGDIDSISDFNDLSPDEQILGAVPSGSTYLILTTNGAWRLGISEGKFVFQQIYYSKECDACLVDRNAFASNREVCYFFASDGVYAISQFSAAPEWVEWINKGIPQDFLGATCKITASEYNTETHELLFSSATLNKTFVVNTRESSSGLIDKGFNALLCCGLDKSDDLVMWWARSGICTPERLAEMFPVGLRDDARVLPAAEKVAGQCDAFDNPCPPQCKPANSLLAVTADDNAIKVFDEDFYGRERRTASGVVVDAYGCRLVTPCMNFGLTDGKRTTVAIIDFMAMATDSPAKISIMVGVASNPVEPTEIGLCNVNRFQLSDRVLECTALVPGTSPNAKAARWPFMLEGRFIWFDIKITPLVGGPCCLSRFVTGIARSANAIEA